LIDFFSSLLPRYLPGPLGTWTGIATTIGND
jgi:hypothetical protein